MIENTIFKALADPTRRSIFEKLAAGGMNASALRQGIEISQPAMSQHLSVLRRAGLVREQRQGVSSITRSIRKGWCISSNGLRNIAPIGQHASRL